MSAGISVPFCLFICFLVCSSDALEKITADLGQDVILPCKVPNNINITAVVWRRPDLHPGHVLVYRSGRIDPDNQHPSYQNRVDLQDKEMKDRNFSLILKNVTMEDTGTYECRVFEKGKKYPINNITLEVHPPGNKDEIVRTGGDKDGGDKDGGDKDGGDKDGGDKDGGDKTGIIVGPVVGVILLLSVLGSVGFLIYRRLMRQNPHHPVPLAEPPATEMLPVPESPAEPATDSGTLREPTAEEEPPTDSGTLREPTAEEEPTEM